MYQQHYYGGRTPIVWLAQIKFVVFVFLCLSICLTRRSSLVTKRENKKGKTRSTLTRKKPSAVKFLRVIREAYCFRCRRKRPIKNPRDVVLSNGSSVIKGRCVHCDTKVSVLQKKISFRNALRSVECPTDGVHMCCTPSEGGVRLPDPNCKRWCHEVFCIG